MSATDPTTVTLGALVAERPARGALLERLKLDYCCGGAQTLAEACAARDLDAKTVLALLESPDPPSAPEPSDAGGPAPSEADLRQMSMEELCERIITVHHAPLRIEFFRINQLLATTVRVHGESHPEFAEMRTAVKEIRAEIAPHLDREEEFLFPGCIALERRGVALDEERLAIHEGEHRKLGERLALLRELGGDYDLEQAACRTHAALLTALAEFERHLHEHIHEENNILMPRVREMNARLRDTQAVGAGA